MKTKFLAVGAMMAAVWCTAPLAQTTTTESTTLPGATPQYPPAANSVGVDKGPAMMPAARPATRMHRASVHHARVVTKHHTKRVTHKVVNHRVKKITYPTA
jgi:hypothetical protein